MRVEEFGFGFPPRLFGIKRGETIYSINSIPFGGFVRILGEDGGSRDNPESFGSKTISARMRVVVAGVIMNMILAVVLLMLGNFFGLRIGLFEEELINIARDKKIQIIQVIPGSPAEKAGLKILDEIAGFKTSTGEVIYVSRTEDVQEFTNQHRGEVLSVLIKKGDEALEKRIEARLNPPPGEGSMGIVMALTGVVSYPWYEAIWRGFQDTYIITYNTFYGYYLVFKTLFTDGQLMAGVSGPVGIATITGQAARVGFSYLMQFVALISINLAILNIAPIPALDGGRAVFLIAEKIKGKPLDRRIEAAVNSVGFALLMILMIYITIKDVIKIFSA